MDTDFFLKSFKMFVFWILNEGKYLLCVQFAGKYGKVFSLRLFGGRIVVINGYKLVRETLIEQGENFIDRPNIPLFEDLVGNKGDIIYVLGQKLQFPINLKPSISFHAKNVWLF